MSKIRVPPGYALVSLEDLAALHAAAKAPAPPVPGPVSASYWQGLAAVVGLLTARLGGHDVNAADVTDDIPPAVITAAMLTVTTAALHHLFADHGAGLLRELGLAAAEEGTR